MKPQTLFQPPAASVGAIRLDMVSSGLASKFSPALPPGGSEVTGPSRLENFTKPSTQFMRGSTATIRTRLSGAFVRSRWLAPTNAM